MRKYLTASLILMTCLGASAQQRQALEPAVEPEPLEVRTIDIDGAPWAVAMDGEVIYFTITGKRFDPAETTEDGYIGVIKPGEDKPVMLTKAAYLKSPKGIKVVGDQLAVTDVDHMYMIDKETGKMSAYCNIGTDGPLSQLNGIDRMDDRLIVTCTDKNRLYFVDPTSFTFAELVTKEPIAAPSGVVWDSETRMIYICENAFETDRRDRKTPTGRLLGINPITGEVTELKLRMDKELRGQFTGLALKDGELYFADWSKDKTPEAIRKYNLKTKVVTNVATAPMQAVSDFAVRGRQLIIPALIDQKIFIANMPVERKR